MLAGLLVKLVGAPLAVLVDCVTYLFSAVMVATLAVPEPLLRRPGDATRKARTDPSWGDRSGGEAEDPPGERPGERPIGGRAARAGLRREIGDGLRWIYRGSGLATLAIATHVWFAANAVLGVVVAPFALIALGLSPLQFGLVTAGTGAGGVVGAAVSTAAGRRWGTGGAVIVAHLITSGSVVVMASAGVGTGGWSAAVVLGLGQFGHGLAIGLSNSHEMSYRQALTPDDLQARTNTTMRSFNRAVVVVVAPPAGILADRLGLRQTLLVAAAVFVVSVAILAASPFRTARLEDAAEMV